MENHFLRCNKHHRYSMKAWRDLTDLIRSLGAMATVTNPANYGGNTFKRKQRQNLSTEYRHKRCCCDWQRSNPHTDTSRAPTELVQPSLIFLPQRWLMSSWWEIYQISACLSKLRNKGWTPSQGFLHLHTHYWGSQWRNRKKTQSSGDVMVKKKKILWT